MIRSVSIADAKAHFSDRVRDAENGVAVLVTRRGQAVVGIVSAEDVLTLARLRASGPAGGLASVAGRFSDAPEFADDLDALVLRRSRRAPADLGE